MTVGTVRFIWRSGAGGEGAGVRRVASLLALSAIALASCVPEGHPPAQRRPVRRPSGPQTPIPSVRPSAVRAGPSAAEHRQCLAALTADGARYEEVPDHIYNAECSILGGVKLNDIGIPVTNLGQMTCPLADALTRWTRDATQKAAVAWLDSPVVKIESFGTYSCRPINNQAGNRLSEHGLSNAVDISGFVLANGKRITVLDDWNSPDQYVRNFLRAVHDAGCRRFQVVLGPDANALHRNHFHFDMGPGRYCK